MCIKQNYNIQYVHTRAHTHKIKYVTMLRNIKTYLRRTFDSVTIFFNIHNFARNINSNK